MSFMFKPFPYDDPNSINHIKVDSSVTDGISCGNSEVYASINARIKEAKVVAIDGYATADFQSFISGLDCDNLYDVRQLYLAPEVISAMLADYLPVDRVTDPVLLYGKLFKGGLKALMDSEKLNALVQRIQAKESIVIYGNGALIDEIRCHADLRVYLDITPKEAALRNNRNEYVNIGDTVARPFKERMRRNYYVDFESEMNLRKKLLVNGEIDLYVYADKRDELKMVPFASLSAMFDCLVNQPFRCKPVYLEGVWGGSYMMEKRKLPKTMKNCAWIFDLIPSEVSLVIEANGKDIEVPYYTFVHYSGSALLGKDCHDYFKGYFPVRFNYDDTWHANGNMSVQCHPYHDYIMEQNHELGRQDESYYVVEAAQGAKTYLGFKDGADVNEFYEALAKSEKEGTEVDYAKYINAVPSTPGTQVLIPAGTIHSSGRNQVVLEIGSLTIGSYTYKMYDYLRKDFDGNPRPIHLIHGKNVLQTYRTTEWIEKNVVRRGSELTDRMEEVRDIVGQHDLLYFQTETVQFWKKYEDHTNGSFHVLAVTNGEHVKIYDKHNPDACFYANYLDLVVIPETIKEYVVENMGVDAITIHKTRLRDDFLGEFTRYESAFEKGGKKYYEI